MTKILIVLGSGSKLDCDKIRKALRPLKLGRDLRVVRIADMAKGAARMERTAREIAEYAYTRCTPDLCIGVWGGDHPLPPVKDVPPNIVHHELAYIMERGQGGTGIMLAPDHGAVFIENEGDEDETEGFPRGIVLSASPALSTLVDVVRLFLEAGASEARSATSYQLQ